MKKSVLVAIVVANLAIVPSVFADAKNGEKLFNDKGAMKCTICHAFGKKVVGPDLADVSKRHTPKWIVSWLTNTQATWTGGDPETADLQKRVNKVGKPKTAHATPPVSEAQATDIADFLMTK